MVIKTPGIWLAVVALSVPVWGQTQQQPWAGFDAGRADRLVAQPARSDGAAVRHIQAQPLRGDAAASASVQVNRYPSQNVTTFNQTTHDYRSDVGVHAAYQRGDDRDRFAIGVRASSVSTTAHHGQTYFAHPGATITHVRQYYPRHIMPPIVIYPHRQVYCPPAVIVHRPVFVHRPIHHPCYPVHPGSGSSFYVGFSYRR